tara:strand:+ start:1470 stop:3509 length:2040 start_codon:yes stop_codon:yes gene_type:complete
MKLTDNDKREIVQLIQDNKPLPDKYRFLLFKGREEIELLWNGKDNSITNIELPFQIIEHVDEPRNEEEIKLQGNLFDESGRQLSGWSNKLIWGNNNLILSSLINGPMSKEIEDNGGLKLVYIDPPFNVGDDFNVKINVDEENKFEKRRNFLEEIAYRDTWGEGSDSFISMLYERLQLIKQLLSEDGSIFVHCDYRVNSLIRLILDEIFGEGKFINEIIWTYTSGGKSTKSFGKKHDTIYWYSKSDNYEFNIDDVRIPYSEKTLQNYKPGLKGSTYTGDVKINEKGKIPEDYWDISIASKSLKENLNYPTQKPEKLLERIIKCASSENDLIADFFCGSGTTLAVAEKLNRKWIGTDLGKFAIHTSKKRLIQVQRKKKDSGENYRAFELLNLGKYQRENFISKTETQDKNKYYIEIILKAYGAETINNQILHGVKNNRYVFVGPINLHVSRKAVEEVVSECVKNKITKVDILCFEHEQGLFPNIINEAKEKGVDINCKIIPPDVFDKRAIEKKQVVFHDVAYIEFKPIVKKNKISVALTGFSVDYSDDKLDEVLSELKSNSSKIILNNGQIIKISRDKNGIEKKEILTKSWKDWIDYWAVDFDFENKKEVFKRKKDDNSYEEVWTGDYIFENEWQSFRLKNTELEFTSASKEITSKKFTKVAVKVVDIFGNDTMRVLKVNL